MERGLSTKRRQITIKNEFINTNILQLKLNELSFNLFFLLLSQIDSKKDDQLFCYITTIDEIAILFNKKRISKSHLVNAAEQLLDIKIYQNENIATGVSFFSKFEMEGNTIRLKIDNGLVDYFLQITKEDRFFKCYLDEFVSLKNLYAKQLYILMRKNLNKTYITTIRIDLLYKIFGINVDEEFKSFNRRVIKNSIQEINKHTSLNIAISYTKKSREVTAINFSIKESKKIENILTNKKHENIVNWANGKPSEIDNNKDLLNIMAWANEDSDETSTSSEIIDAEIIDILTIEDKS